MPPFQTGLAGTLAALALAACQPPPRAGTAAPDARPADQPADLFDPAYSDWRGVNGNRLDDDYRRWRAETGQPFSEAFLAWAAREADRRGG